MLIEPKDAKGNGVEPFVYNGTTYLPVRVVGQAFNKEVRWDGATSTVYIGDDSGAENPAKELPLYSRSYLECSDPRRIDSKEESGVSYIHYGAETKSTETEKYSGRYFRTAYVTYPPAEGVLKICNSNDEVIYTSPVMRESTDPVKFSVDVEGEISVKLIFENTSSDSASGGNMYIKNPTILSTGY